MANTGQCATRSRVQADLAREPLIQPALARALATQHERSVAAEQESFGPGGVSRFTPTRATDAPRLRPRNAVPSGGPGHGWCLWSRVRKSCRGDMRSSAVDRTDSR